MSNSSGQQRQTTSIMVNLSNIEDFLHLEGPMGRNHYLLIAQGMSHEVWIVGFANRATGVKVLTLLF